MAEKGFVLVRTKKRFPGLSPLAFEHPMDAAALESLKKIPAMDTLLKLLFRLVDEKRSRLLFLSSTVRVSPRQFGYVYDLYEEALDILQMETRPELFIQQETTANAYAYGVDHPFIVLHSSLLDLLEKDELQSVIAHELGHILAGHMLYRSVLLTCMDLLRMGGIGLPLGQLGLRAFLVGLFEWSRRAELTCDRAGLLVVQDLQACLRAEMKLVGGNHMEHMSLDEFFRQAEEYEAQDDMLHSIYKILNNWGTTHPHAVARMRELKRWHDEGNYQDILNGDYITRDEEEHQAFTAQWKAGVDEVREDIRRRGDSISKVVTQMADFGEGIAQSGVDLFQRWFQGGEEDEPPKKS